MPEATTPNADALPHDEVIPVLDFGSQYVQLICRRIREAGAFAILVRPDISLDELRAMKPKGIVLSGGPSSVYVERAPTPDPNLLDIGVPILGICYGMQVASRLLGSHVEPAESREFGRRHLSVLVPSSEPGLFRGVPETTTVWMSHGDQIRDVADQFYTLASTPTCPHAAIRHKDMPLLGVQFHPEVTHTPHGVDMLRNFIYDVCGCRDTWRMSDFVDTAAQRVREQVGDARAICGLSGGVDSSVAAALIHKAIGDRLTCVFVDNGLLRKNERDFVEATFRDHFDIDLRVIDASDAFLSDLAGINDPQEKRRRIGHRFIEVFKDAAEDIDDARFLVQGTLYPDVIESGHGHSGAAANIKLHHNVGGLPDELGFELVEPLRDLFKDEVRKLGEVLGLPDAMVWRHPFPGPGLAVRVLGEVTRDKLDVLREADAIFQEELVASGYDRKTSQAFTVLLPVQSVGVMGDGRTYENVAAIRAVETSDFMTADWAHLPHELLSTVSSRIINEVRGINRVVYDISSKPPATIEWE
ncbi:MAG: glutamine-hydrolyzing GMP synthase [Planctomycetota bacterium]